MKSGRKIKNNSLVNNGKLFNMVKEDKKHDKLDKNEDAMIKEDKNLEEKEENDKKNRHPERK